MKTSRMIAGVRLLIFSSLLINLSFADKIDMKDAKSNSSMVDHSKSLSENNQFFWKGLYGFIAPDVYVKKNDERNSFHNSIQQIYQGGDTELVEVVHIDDKAKFRKVTNKQGESIDTGILIVFTKRKVFVLNFNEKRFGWYER